MTVMSAFDIPIHTKNISTRDFAMRTESDPPLDKICRKERHAPIHVTAALVASCMTVWYALQKTLADDMHLASCIHFYVAAVVPMLLYDHILTPSRSKNMWVLLVLHVGGMLFAYPYDREYVSFRLHLLLLGLAIVGIYKQVPVHSSQYLFVVGSSANSAVSLCVYTQDTEASFLYYHASFVLLFVAVVLMLYTS
jgi:hypothetical protein